MPWELLYVVASVFLVKHIGGPNLVWCSVAIGVVIGLVLTAWLGIHWWVLGRSMAVAVSIAGVVEVIRGMADRRRPTPPDS